MAKRQLTPAVKRFRTGKKSAKNLQDNSASSSAAHHLVDVTAGALALLLGIRFVSVLFGSTNGTGFGKFLTVTTQPLVEPFIGIVPNSPIGAMDGGVVETATLFSMMSIAFLAYAFQQLLYALKPNQEIYGPQVAR